MKKCLEITLIAKLPDGFMKNYIQKYARQLEIEGTAQVVGENEIRIIACGTKDKVDDFLDVLHKGSGKYIPEDIIVEPFIKEKDYRGIFRIIE